MAYPVSDDFDDDAEAPAPGMAGEPVVFDDDLAGEPVTPDEDVTSEPVTMVVGAALAGSRLDKALAELAPPGLSRSRLRALIEGGAVRRADGEAVRDPRLKVKTGDVFTVAAPPPEPARPGAEAIPLSVVWEDAHLIVIDKPAGMVVHPAPGAATGTLVNALLAHCGASLSGVGGERRPGIVHRIDKDTSGLLVVAKSDAAHHELSAQFAAHAASRSYVAVCHGTPEVGDPKLRGMPGVTAEPGGWLRIETSIDRSRSDRTKMAVTQTSGRHAVTRLRAEAKYGEGGRGAARLTCRLETGRTHQIRVHCAWAGHPLIGDPVYARGRAPAAALSPEARAAAAAFPRQALHAATLGFEHPVTGAALSFESPLPADMAALIAALEG